MRAGRPFATQALPLSGGAGNRYGPWIVAAALYVAVLALAATMAIGDAEQAWRTALAGKISVQVPASSETVGEPLAEIVALLRATPAIAEAEPVDAAIARSLLEPWLGAGAEIESLPIPALIDVRLHPGARLDIVDLEVALDAAVSGTRIDDHGIRLAGLLRFTGALQAFGAAVTAIFGLIALLAVSFATQAGLSAHRAEIGILQQIGARDSDITRRFVTHSRRLAFKGGVAGCALAAATLVLLDRFAPQGDTIMVPETNLSPIQWGVIACLPLVATAFGMATAHLTAMRALSRTT